MNEGFKFNKKEIEKIEEIAKTDVIHEDSQMSKLNDLDSMIKESKEIIKEIEDDKSNDFETKKARIRAEEMMIENMEEEKKKIIESN